MSQLRCPVRDGRSALISIHHYLHLASVLGARTEIVAPRIAVTQMEVLAIQQRFGAPPTQDTSRPLFGLVPGAEDGPAKRWPEDRFVAAALAVHRRTGCDWWILGGPADRPLAESIAAQFIGTAGLRASAIRSLAGETSLRELCAALKACQIVLTNDTGPMHLAAAVGTPVVVPFGSTSPELTGPGLPGNSLHRLLKADVPCAPCFLRECPVDFRCMNRISVADVVDAVVAVWEQTKSHCTQTPK